MVTKKVVKIGFSGFWNGFDPKDNCIVNILSQKYKVIICDYPDYMFFSCFNYPGNKYNDDCIKIHYTGENVVADFNRYDYVIGVNHITFSDRYLRFPVWAYDYKKPNVYKDRVNVENCFNRKFCSFVYSNPHTEEHRKRLFELISSYKGVDSGGRYLNNIGYYVEDKIDFISKYKFNIACENSICEGYVTEKIYDAFIARTIPIYFGDPKVETDFNPKAFINANNFESDKELLEYIEYLDNNEEAYMEMLNQDPLTEEAKIINTQEPLADFLTYIIEQDKTKAKRIESYWYVLNRDTVAYNDRCYRQLRQNWLMKYIIDKYFERVDKKNKNNNKH